ncbi:MAG: ABC transporter permease [Bacteroidales bacterium]|nr:ABC transporter permease [Bacteroidales bacterium]
MNLNKLGIIISREYLNKVQKKSFLLTTFGVPVLFALMYVVMLLIMFKAKEEAKVVAVSDQSGIVMPILEDTERLKFIDLEGAPADSVKNHLKDYGADLLLAISPIDSVAKTVSAATYSDKPLGIETVEMLEHRVNSAVEDYRIESYGIDGLRQIMDDVQADIDITSYTVDEAGKETISQSEVYMILSMILGMGLYLFIALFCGMVMTSVIEEKSSRVVEVLVSSVKATELMFGKIIGVALVALTQFLLWIVLTLGIVGVISAVWGVGNLLSGGEKVAEMTSVPGVDAGAVPGTIDLESVAALAAQADTTAAAEGPSGLDAVLQTLGGLNYLEIGIAFLLFFIFGYLLYASMFAAIGSAVENEADTQQLQIPITIPLMLGFFIAIYAFRAPGSSIVFWGSMIPFTSPIVMLARIPFGVAAWELVLSLVLLVATFVVCAWGSAKIYKVGILMYGKKSTFKDLWKWLKQS